jgi:hypothetical protein
MDEWTILNAQRGSIAAPAGCGKTHLIAKTLEAATDDKPTLVLTHTNAGVSALRNRLDSAKIKRARYRISTLDGWAMRLVATFPKGSGQTPDILALKKPRTDYPCIRAGALKILNDGYVGDLLTATYARLIVDEYQDCQKEQHAFVVALSNFLPTCVLGDEMQAIFGWSGASVDWQDDVESQFPSLGTLQTPWRWKNVGCGAFGQWLLQARSALQSGQTIDLVNAPPEVSWINLNCENPTQAIINACHTKSPVEGGDALIICEGKNKERHRQLASRVKGATVVENADLTDFIDFTSTYDFAASNAAERLIDFAANTLTGAGASDLKNRLKILLKGTAQKQASDVEQAAVDFERDRSPVTALNLLVEINKQVGVSPLRPSILRACIQALDGCKSPDDFYELSVRAREQARILGRSVPRRAVGSTLLLKGLEADVCVVVDADGLDAKDIYVAITRGARRLIICSKSATLSRSP